MSTGEQWRPIAGYPGYEVSDEGRVRSLDREVEFGTRTMKVRGRMRQLPLDVHGYPKVSLSRTGHRPRLVFVHHLVLGAFIGPRPAGTEACHNNGIKTDNRATNLRWDTRSENMRDVYRHGAVHPCARKTECPRGHLLQDPNLFESDKQAGRRSCKSCAGTHRSRDGLTWDEFLFKADTAYHRLTGLAPNLSAAGRSPKKVA